MSEIERQARNWWARLLAWLRGAQGGEAARKARETLQDVRTSDAGRRAESALPWPCRPCRPLPPALCRPAGLAPVLTSWDTARPRCPGLPPWPRDGYSEVQGIRAAQEQVHVAVGGAEMPGPPLDLHRC